MKKISKFKQIRFARTYKCDYCERTFTNDDGICPWCHSSDDVIAL